MTRAQWIEVAEQALDAHKELALEFAAEIVREGNAEVERVEFRATAVESLLGTDNPATGKPHSASSADAAVSQSADYLSRVRRLSEIVADKEKARHLLAYYRLRGELAIAVVREPVVVGLA